MILRIQTLLYVLRLTGCLGELNSLYNTHSKGEGLETFNMRQKNVFFDLLFFLVLSSLAYVSSETHNLQRVFRPEEYSLI